MRNRPPTQNLEKNHGKEQTQNGTGGNAACRHPHRHQRERPQRHQRRLVTSAGRHLHALPDHAQLPLERDRADVQLAARDVHGAVHRAVERGRPDRRAHPLARPRGAGFVRAIRRAHLVERRAGRAAGRARHGARAGRRPRGRGAYRAQHLRDRRQGERRADR